MSIRTIQFIPAPSPPPIEAADQMFTAIQAGSVEEFNYPSTASLSTWTSGGNSYGVSVDEETEKVYWTIFTNDAVRRSDYDGGSTETIVSAADPAGCDVDSTYVYWVEFNANRIRRADKEDGSGATSIRTGRNDPRDIHVDLVNEHLYYVLRGGTDVRRCDLDGGNDVLILGTSGFIYGVDIDVDNEHIYYADQSNEQIRRVDFDGSNDTLIYDAGGGSPDNQNIQGMCLELESGVVHWTDVLDHNTGVVDIDGSSPNKNFETRGSGNPNLLDVKYPQGSYDCSMQVFQMTQDLGIDEDVAFEHMEHPAEPLSQDEWDELYR